MKINRLLYLLFVLSAFLMSCSSDDDKDNGEIVEQKISITAELLQPEGRMEFEDGEGANGGVKSTWQAGDVIRLYTTASTPVYVATLTLEADDAGKDVGTFVSDGLVRLNNNTPYQAIAMSAKKLATLTNTNFPNSTTPVFSIQVGNEGMQHIADETILKSTDPLTYTYTSTLTEDGGTVEMGKFDFIVKDYSVLAFNFTLPADEMPTYLSVSINPTSTTPANIDNFDLQLTDITAGEEVTAYLIVPTGITSLPSGSTVSILTKNGNLPVYQYRTDTDLTIALGNRYLKKLKLSDFLPEEETGFYLRELQKNIEKVGLKYEQSIIYFADGNIRILDPANPAIGLFTVDIRKAFNTRTENIDVIFPNIVTFPNGNSSAGTVANAGCFRDVATISSMDVPNCITIGDYAFKNCEALVNTNFPKVETVRQYAFQNSLALKELIFPNGKTIKGYGLYGVNNLELLELPKVTEIGEASYSVSYSYPEYRRYASMSAFGVDSDTKTADNLKIVLGTELPKGTATTIYYDTFNYRFADSFNATNNFKAGKIDLVLGECYASQSNAYKPSVASQAYTNQTITNTSTGGGNVTDYKVTIGDTYSSAAATTNNVGYYWWTRNSEKRFGYNKTSRSSSDKPCYTNGVYNGKDNCHYQEERSYATSNTAYGKFNSITIKATESETIEGESGAENGNGGIFTPGGEF